MKAWNNNGATRETENKVAGRSRRDVTIIKTMKRTEQMEEEQTEGVG